MNLVPNDESVPRSEKTVLAHIQGTNNGMGNLVRSIAPAGNIFLLASLSELRRQGLTYLAFSGLQRVIRAPTEMSEPRSSLRQNQ